MNRLDVGYEISRLSSYMIGLSDILMYKKIIERLVVKEAINYMYVSQKYKQLCLRFRRKFEHFTEYVPCF